MKKSNLILLSLFLLIFGAACDKDDDTIYFDVPSSATEGIGEDEIRLLIKASSSDSLVFAAGFEEDESKRVWVNWGDDNILHSYNSGKITHKYKETEREYIVTIKAAGIKAFEYSHQESVSKTRSLAFGKCPSLESFRASLNENVYENFDFSQCPQFTGPIEFHCYTDKFNFNGLKNFSEIVFSAKKIIPKVEMKDMNFTYLNFGMQAKYEEDKKVEYIRIENKREDISFFHIYIEAIEGNYNRIPRLVEELVLDIPQTKFLRLFNIAQEKPLNLSKIKYIESLHIYSSNFPSIEMPQDIKIVFMDNQRVHQYVDQKLEFLDFSKCPSMEDIAIWDLTNLKLVNIDGLKKLKEVSISGSPHVEIIGDLPEKNDINTRNAIKQERRQDDSQADKYMINLKANKLN